MRRDIYTPMRADLTFLDFVQTLTVREKGFRVVYQDQALLYEDALASADDEYRMRVRVDCAHFPCFEGQESAAQPLQVRGLRLATVFAQGVAVHGLCFSGWCVGFQRHPCG